jgi:hypothetical protein
MEERPARSLVKHRFMKDPILRSFMSLASMKERRSRSFVHSPVMKEQSTRSFMNSRLTKERPSRSLANQPLMKEPAGRSHMHAPARRAMLRARRFETVPARPARCNESSRAAARLDSTFQQHVPFDSGHAAGAHQHPMRRHSRTNILPARPGFISAASAVDPAEWR